METLQSLLAVANNPNLEADLKQEGSHIVREKL